MTNLNFITVEILPNGLFSLTDRKANWSGTYRNDGTHKGLNNLGITKSEALSLIQDAQWQAFKREHNL